MNSTLFFTEIPVQIGSNKMLININELKKKMLCADFLDLVLKKCKLNVNKSISNTYAVFEYVNGIERMVNNDENIIHLWVYWKNNKNDVKFIIRKTRLSDKVSLIIPHQQQQSIMKYYKKSKAIIKNDLNDNQLSKKRKLSSVAIEINVNNKTEELTNQNEVKNSKSTSNILQYFYLKIKHQQQSSNKYKILNDDRKCSDEDSLSCSENDSSRLNLKSFF